MCPVLENAAEIIEGGYRVARGQRERCVGRGAIVEDRAVAEEVEYREIEAVQIEHSVAVDRQVGAGGNRPHTARLQRGTVVDRGGAGVGVRTGESQGRRAADGQGE